MNYYYLALGILMIVFGFFLLIFNNKFTKFKINQRRTFFNKLKVKKHDKLFNSKGYFRRQKIQYKGIGVIFIIGGLFTLLLFFNLINQQLKIIFYIFLAMVGLITTFFYYKDKY